MGFIKRGLLLFTFFIISSNIFAQKLSVGVWAGISNYFGDLNTNANFEYAGPGAGFFVRRAFNTRFAYKAGVNYGKVAFSDEANDNSFQTTRNLSFESSVIEFNNQIEFNFFKFDVTKPKHNFTPYILLGVSVFYFNPTTTLDGERVRLQEYATEGQETDDNSKGKYVRASFAIPMGFGFKYSFDPRWTLGLEGGIRKTFTDYLDDISGEYPVYINNTPDNALGAQLSDRSGEVGEPIGLPGKQRGSNNRKDDYLFVGLSLSYNIIKVTCPNPSAKGF